MGKARSVHSVCFLMILVLTVIATSCSNEVQSVPIAAPTHPVAAVGTQIPIQETSIVSTSTIAPTDVAAVLGPRPAYLEQLNFTPQQAIYFETVKNKLGLHDDEIRMIARNGFVVSDRLAFADFRSAYAYIYWKDLPVLITTGLMQSQRRKSRRSKAAASERCSAARLPILAFAASPHTALFKLAKICGA